MGLHKPCLKRTKEKGMPLTEAVNKFICVVLLVIKAL